MSVRHFYVCENPNCKITYGGDKKVSHCPKCNTPSGKSMYLGEPEDLFKKHFSRKSSNIKCTYCGSTNTSKIGLLGHIFALDPAAKIGKQMHCNSCGCNF